MTAALAIMDSIYNMTWIGLSAISPPAAADFRKRIPDLQATNEQAFKSDKSLVREILKMGETSGKTLFYGTHLFVLAPVVNTMRVDLAERRAARHLEAEAAEL